MMTATPTFFLSYINPICPSFFIKSIFFKFSLLKKILTFALRVCSICLVLSGLVYSRPAKTNCLSATPLHILSLHLDMQQRSQKGINVASHSATRRLSTGTRAVRTTNNIVLSRIPLNKGNAIQLCSRGTEFI